VVEGVASRGKGEAGGFGGDSHRRRKGGANMRLIRAEDCSLNIESRHNFLLNISISLYFININSYLCVFRHMGVARALFGIVVFRHVCAARMCVLLLV
jgi:hypothetical protein